MKTQIIKYKGTNEILPNLTVNKDYTVMNWEVINHFSDPTILYHIIDDNGKTQLYEAILFTLVNNDDEVQKSK